MKSLTIVHYASVRLLEKLVDSLTAIGCRLNLREGTEWVWNESCCEAVVLLVDPQDYPKERLIAELKSPCHPLTLCLFCAETSKWDSDLIDCCFDFMAWSAQEGELFMRVNRLLARQEIERRCGYPPVGTQDDFMKLNLVGHAPLFLRALRLIEKVAHCEVPVLIEGETGTGKELAARAIHYLSARQDYPFIPVNCGELTDGLLENELFGHAKGAYTDAKQRQAGLIAQAEGGTLFLDEVDSLSAKGQASLLRFLQDRKYRPLGDAATLDADVRVITASNRSLKKLVQGEGFRQDLLFRLNLMHLIMPALRERPGDAELIAEHLMRKYREQYKSPEKFLHADFIHWMSQYDWPGNVRELENTIHREFLLSDRAGLRPPVSVNENDRLINTSGPIEIGIFDDLYNGSFSEVKADFVQRFEKRYLSNLMAETQGNVTLAARMAGKERRAFGKLLKKHGIDRTQYL